MLKIVFGEVGNSVYHPPTYFDNQYEDEWITDPLTDAMIKDIDQSEVVGVHLIQIPVLGLISTKEISGGVKTCSGVEVLCERPCRTLGGNDWNIVLPNIHEQIMKFMAFIPPESIMI